MEETEDDAATQLIQWWEDVTIHGIGSRVVRVAAPSGWGRTTLLDGFTAAVLEAVPFSVVLRMDGKKAKPGAGAAAAWLAEVADDRFVELSKRVLGLNSPEGAALLAAGVAGQTIAPVLGGPLGLVLQVGLGANLVRRQHLFPDPAALAGRVATRLSRLGRGALRHRDGRCQRPRSGRVRRLPDRAGRSSPRPGPRRRRRRPPISAPHPAAIVRPLRAGPRPGGISRHPRRRHGPHRSAPHLPRVDNLVADGGRRPIGEQDPDLRRGVDRRRGTRFAGRTHRGRPCGRRGHPGQRRPLGARGFGCGPGPGLVRRITASASA